MKLFITSIIFILLAYLYSFKFFEAISLVSISKVLTLISASSGVIFTILGLWIAYVYPNAIIKLAKPSMDEIEYRTN